MEPVLRRGDDPCLVLAVERRGPCQVLAGDRRCGAGDRAVLGAGRGDAHRGDTETCSPEQPSAWDVLHHRTTTEASFDNGSPSAFTESESCLT